MLLRPTAPICGLVFSSACYVSLPSAGNHWSGNTFSGTSADTSTTESALDPTGETTTAASNETFHDVGVATTRSSESSTSVLLDTESGTTGEASGSSGDTVPNGLAAHFEDDFSVGVALEPWQLDVFEDILVRDFNRLTAENAMKPSSLQPSEGAWSWDSTDALMHFAQQHGWHATGHTLLWHTDQGARWMTDARDRDYADAALCEHIGTAVTRLAATYPGVIDNWDVVNEAVMDGGGYRTDSPWYETYGGPEFILRAFECAANAVDATGQDIKLYYNDYNVYEPGKLASIVELVHYVQDHGGRIDGVGLQGHWNIEYPDTIAIETAFLQLIDAGVEIKISELDISIYNDYTSDGREPEQPTLPEDRETLQADRYADFFTLFRTYAEHVAHVTLWGVSDDVSWLDTHGAVRDRNDYPLLFDDDHEPKEAYERLLNL